MVRYQVPKTVHVPGRGVRAVHTAEKLIAATRGKLGLEPRWQIDNRGQATLAAWLVTERGALAAIDASAHPIIERGEQLDRIVAGEVVPSDEVAVAIAMLTDGRVTPDMFEERVADRAAKPDTRASDHARVSDGEGAAPASLPVAPTDRDAVSIGVDFGDPRGDMSAMMVLGDVPAGPLFSVRHVDGKYVVGGLGMSIALSPAAFCGLHHACSLALLERSSGRVGA